MSIDRNEYYTPKPYVTLVKDVFGGVIDLDPASCERANETVGALHYFTKDEDGLRQAWFGSVFLNPPYSQPLCSQFISKLMDEYMANRVDQAIVLVNNATETKHFQSLLSRYPCCFPKRRISFYHPELGKAENNRQAQAFFYLGDNNQRFIEVFGRVGTVVLRVPEQVTAEARETR